MSKRKEDFAVFVPTRYLIVEGPDLSGKTTLIKEIHKQTNFHHNIHDRSCLSMMIYDQMRNGKNDNQYYSMKFEEELNDLNNKFVIIRPAWETLAERFKKRGDDIQNIESLKNLNQKFSSCIWMSPLSTVQFLDGTNDPEIDAHAVIDWIHLKENPTDQSSMCQDIISHVRRFGEVKFLKFEFFDESTIFDRSILNDAKEGEYYRSIWAQFMSKISAEKKGFNEKLCSENVSSRRFIYTGDSCISLIQCLLRDEFLHMHVVMRSSNVGTIEKDLSFLRFLGNDARRHICQFYKNVPIYFKITLSSAHIAP